MDIKSISVESFRGHEKFELELAEKLTIVTGPNGSGKSSILEAVATVLLGENTWTGRDGIRIQSLIKKGEKQAKVSIMGKRKISRVIGPKGTKILLDDKDSLTQFELLSNLKVSESQVRSALIPRAFLSLSIKEQKDALFGLLGQELRLGDVAEYIPETAKATWIKIATRWEADHEDDGENPVVDIDKLYRTVYDARKNYKAKTSPTSPKNEDNDKLVKELSEISSKIAQANFESEKRKATDKEIARIPELEKKVILLSAKAPAAMDDFELKNTDAISAHAAADEKLAGIEREIEQLDKEIKQFEKAKVESGKKVVCPIGLECPHDEAALKNRRTYLVRNREAKIEEKDKASEVVRNTEQAHRDLLSQKGEAESQKKEYEDAQRDLEKAKALKASAAGQKAPDLAALQKEKARIEDALKAAAAGQKAPEPDPTVDHLNKIVEALNVDGIKTDIIKKGVAQIEEEANETLSKFGPYAIRFFLDGEEYQPAILHRGGEFQVGELSEGERLTTSLVLQDVFAQRSRINLCVLDDVDVMDAERFKKFVWTALELKSKVLIGLANEAHAGQHLDMDFDGDTCKLVNLTPKSGPPAGRQDKKGSGKKPLEEIL